MPHWVTGLGCGSGMGRLQRGLRDTSDGLAPGRGGEVARTAEARWRGPRRRGGADRGGEMARTAEARWRGPRRRDGADRLRIRLSAAARSVRVEELDDRCG